MDQSVGFSVLVVDNDERSLANLVNILIGWKYKVLTANSAQNALETLREFEGFFDLIITEFHIHGMDGFEFQKCIKDEFQLPIIMISNDNRKDIISKRLENGVALHISKPFCANDFKDIWKYASTSCNIEKPILAQDANLSTSSPNNDSKSSRKNGKRKIQDDDNNEGRCQVLKKPKVYWNSHLHNLFLHAIKQIGVEKAVPKKILEVMNISHLTRENVASHLQKYRLFLKKVVGKGMVEGLSHRALRSKFAESLPISMIHDIQQRYEKNRDPSQQRHSYINPFNKVLTSLLDQKVATNNTFATTHHGRSQFPYYSKVLNQVLQEKSTLGSNNGKNNVANSAMLSTFGGEHGLMTSQNYGSIGNHNFNYGLENCNMGSLTNSNIQPQISAYHSNNNFFGIQMNYGSLIGSSANNNSSRFINGENINVNPLGNENFGLSQGEFGSQFVSNVGVGGSEREFSTTLVTAGNNFGVTEMSQDKQNDNVVGHEQQYTNASSTSESEANLMEEDPTKLFLMLDDMSLFNDLMEENNLTASEFPNVEFSNSSNIEQPLYQFDGAEGVTVPPTNVVSNFTNSEQNSTQLQCSDIFVKENLDDKFAGDIIGSSNTSATELDLDMDKIEALFGTLDD